VAIGAHPSTSDRRLYFVFVREDDVWWAIDVPDVLGVFTRVRKDDLIEPMAREAIGLALHVPQDSFDVAVTFESFGPRSA